MAPLRNTEDPIIAAAITIKNCCVLCMSKHTKLFYNVPIFSLSTDSSIQKNKYGSNHNHISSSTQLPSLESLDWDRK